MQSSIARSNAIDTRSNAIEERTPIPPNQSRSDDDQEYLSEKDLTLLARIYAGRVRFLAVGPPHNRQTSSSSHTAEDRKRTMTECWCASARHTLGVSERCWGVLVITRHDTVHAPPAHTHAHIHPPPTQHCSIKCKPFDLLPSASQARQAEARSTHSLHRGGREQQRRSSWSALQELAMFVGLHTRALPLDLVFPAGLGLVCVAPRPLTTDRDWMQRFGALREAEGRRRTSVPNEEREAHEGQGCGGAARGDRDRGGGGWEGGRVGAGWEQAARSNASSLVSALSASLLSDANAGQPLLTTEGNKRLAGRGAADSTALSASWSSFSASWWSAFARAG